MTTRDEKPEVLTLTGEQPPEEVPPEPGRTLGQRLGKFFSLFALFGGLFSVVLCCGLGGSYAWWWISAPAELPAGGRVLVLPFVEQQDDAAWLADGLTEDLVVALSKVEGLDVVGLDQVRALAGDERELAEIGASVGARFVVQGSVKPGDGQVRVDLGMVDVEAGGEVLAEIYRRPAGELFNLEDQLLRDVVRGARLPLVEGLVVDRRTDVPAAWMPFIEGRHRCRQGDPASIAMGVEAFTRAVTADEAFVDAWAGLARCWVQAADKGGVAEADALPQAGAALDKALALDAALADDAGIAALKARVGR